MLEYTVHSQVCKSNNSIRSDVFVLMSPFYRSTETDCFESILDWELLGEYFKCFGTILDDFDYYILIAAHGYAHKT